MDEADGRRFPEQRRPQEGRRAPVTGGDDRRLGRGSEPLDQRLERWMSRGRELVDGVSGARPGARPGGPPNGRRGGLPPQGNGGLGAGGITPGGLGRWVEDRLDWLLDDDSDDDWREPWQAQPPRAARSSERPPGPTPSAPPLRVSANSLRREDSGSAPAPATPAPGRRRSLEAISRRSPTPEAAADPAPGEDNGAWPDDASFSLPRWQRPLSGPSAQPLPLPRSGPPTAAGPSPGPDGGEGGGGPGGRPLPRSTRRR
jgi:hypothetical protein